MARPRIPQSRKKPVRLPTLFRNTQHEELNLKLVPHGHLTAMAEGRGDVDAFLTVCFRVLVGATLTIYADEEGEKQLEAEFDPALLALVAVGDRYANTLKMGMTGDELRSLKNALTYTDELQDLTTRRQQIEAYTKVERIVGGFDFTMSNLHKAKRLGEEKAANMAQQVLH